MGHSTVLALGRVEICVSFEKVTCMAKMLPKLLRLVAGDQQCGIPLSWVPDSVLHCRSWALGLGRLWAAVLICVCSLDARVWNVGSEYELKSLAAIPVLKFKKGDILRIHHRSTPYREKLFIGWQNATVEGVPGPNGELPVIEGDGAVTSRDLQFWNEERAVVRVSGSSVPPDSFQSGLTIRKLEIRNGRLKKSFIPATGQQLPYPYSENAACVHVEKGENLLFEELDLHGCGIGLFVGSTPDRPTRNVIIRSCRIHDNSYHADGQSHNTYVEAINVLYEFNTLIMPPGRGSNIKDRSIGLVVRYNWIEGGNRLIDAVNSGRRLTSPNDVNTFPDQWYGNVFLKHSDYTNNQLFHYGGDTPPPETWRQGTLDFFNNTVISDRGAGPGNSGVTVFSVSSPGATVRATNNVFHFRPLPHDGVILLEPARASTGRQLFLSNSWITEPRCSGLETFRCVLAGPNIDLKEVQWGGDPAFVNEPGRDYRPDIKSRLVDSGAPMNVEFEYSPKEGRVKRVVNGAIDIGAFERALP